MKDWIEFTKPTLADWLYGAIVGGLCGGIVGAVAGLFLVWLIRGSIF